MVINVFQLSFTVGNNSKTEGTHSYGKQSKLTILGDRSQRGSNHFFLQLPHVRLLTLGSGGGKSGFRWEEPQQRKVSFYII